MHQQQRPRLRPRQRQKLVLRANHPLYRVVKRGSQTRIVGRSLEQLKLKLKARERGAQLMRRLLQSGAAGVQRSRGPRKAYSGPPPAAGSRPAPSTDRLATGLVPNVAKDRVRAYSRATDHAGWPNARPGRWRSTPAASPPRIPTARYVPPSRACRASPPPSHRIDRIQLLVQAHAANRFATKLGMEKVRLHGRKANLGGRQVGVTRNQPAVIVAYTKIDAVHGVGTKHRLPASKGSETCSPKGSSRTGWPRHWRG